MKWFEGGRDARRHVRRLMLLRILDCVRVDGFTVRVECCCFRKRDHSDLADHWDKAKPVLPRLSHRSRRSPRSFSKRLWGVTAATQHESAKKEPVPSFCPSPFASCIGRSTHAITSAELSVTRNRDPAGKHPSYFS